MNAQHTLIRNLRRQSGYSLFEVMIAMVLLAVGLVGLAGMQVSGLVNNQGAYHSSQATMLAYDIADRMRANPAGVDAQNYVIAADDADPVIPAGENCEGVTCTSSQMATYDLAQWRGAARSLPGGTSSIARIVTGAVVTHTITIYWDEYRQGIAGTACGPDPKVDLRCVSLTL